MTRKRESGIIRESEATGESASLLAHEETGGKPITGDLLWGLAGAAVFVVTAIFLTILGYIYGDLADIAPEFPLVFSKPFLLMTLVIMAGSPCLSIMAARRFAGSRLDTAYPAGAAAGFLIAVSLWLWVNGANGNPLDWPNLLWFLQIGSSGAAAGAVIGTRVYRSRNRMKVDTAGRGMQSVAILKSTLVLSLVAAVVMTLPFLFMWYAMRSFQDMAAEEAARLFKLPDNVALSVVDEGAQVEALGSNRRYKAAAAWETNGRSASIAVIGNRHGYVIDPENLTASLQAEDVPYEGLVDWDEAGPGSATALAVRELAGTFCRVPLEYVSTTGTDSQNRVITFRGNGIEAAARPGRTNRSGNGKADGIYLTFFSVGIINR